MPIYCNDSDYTQSRVTFPDSSVETFPSPIEITCEEQIPFPRWITINTTAVRGDGVVLTDSRLYWYTGETIQYKIDTNNNGTLERLRLFWRRSRFEAHFWANVALSSVESQGGIASYSYTVDSGSNNQFLITVKDLDGNILFDEEYDNCNYSVECLEGCGENELDCGDCCLNCDDLLPRVCNLEILFG